MNTTDRLSRHIAPPYIRAISASTDWIKAFYKIGCAHPESWGIHRVSKFSALGMHGFEWAMVCSACRRRIGIE